jgi:chromate transport protein ChrA
MNLCAQIYQMICIFLLYKNPDLEESYVSKLDIGYAIHLILVSFFLMFQFIKYSKGRPFQKFNVWCLCIITSTLLVFLLSVYLNATTEDNLPKILHPLRVSELALLISTFCKYFSQQQMNQKRRSTGGLSMSMVIIDLAGWATLLIFLSAESI